MCSYATIDLLLFLPLPLHLNRVSPCITLTLALTACKASALAPVLLQLFVLNNTNTGECFICFPSVQETSAYRQQWLAQPPLLLLLVLRFTLTAT